MRRSARARPRVGTRPNYGKNAAGAEVFGTDASPAHDPSVITVGSVNPKGTAGRGDDAVNHFSPRGPTRSSFVDATGMRHLDNLLKPDLVAPGNKVIGALASNDKGDKRNLLATSYNVLPLANYATSMVGQMLRRLSGTSLAAPAVAGTVALMLQANSGLTPPLNKATLQYSAQPIAGASLLQQGAGLLAAGQALPEPSTTANGQTFGWSRVVFVGGQHLASGEALFTRYQPIWDPRLVWVGRGVRRCTVDYRPAASGVPADTFMRSIVEAPITTQVLLTPGVVSATALAGTSALIGRSGAFVPTAALSG